MSKAPAHHEDTRNIVIPSPTEVEAARVRSRLTDAKLDNFLTEFPIDEHYYTKTPLKDDSTCRPHKTKIYVYTKIFHSGFRLLVPPEAVKILHYYGLALAQIQSNSWSMILAFIVFFWRLGTTLSIDLFRRLYMLNKANSSIKSIPKSGWYFFNKQPQAFEMLSRKRNKVPPWLHKFLFMGRNDMKPMPLVNV
ncbi:hypothetical protein NE237_032595 [Protea cynaroides]|uniref:Transposase (putative) gypsy type domain-containing protein n=1 Tax=Protea cynaroides TaxID=273540 RepID=A0A9Q0L3B8_9MAGN|nr:hypothetical protein NE237_032595 [Protea cynaroides]